MIGIVVPETCWAYKKYNKIISGIYLGFYFSINCLFNYKHQQMHLYIYIYIV